MNSTPLKPSQHVERIREILIGRDLHHLQGRLARIEGAVHSENTVDHHFLETITQLRQEQAELRQELLALRQQNPQPAQPSPPSPQLASELAARIDARFRELFSHLQTELTQWKEQFSHDLQQLGETKVDRHELKSRLAQMASAAMADPPTPPTTHSQDGYLL